MIIILTIRQEWEARKDPAALHNGENLLLKFSYDIFVDFDFWLRKIKFRRQVSSSQWCLKFKLVLNDGPIRKQGFDIWIDSYVALQSGLLRLTIL